MNLVHKLTFDNLDLSSIKFGNLLTSICKKLDKRLEKVLGPIVWCTACSSVLERSVNWQQGQKIVLQNQSTLRYFTMHVIVG